MGLGAAALMWWLAASAAWALNNGTVHFSRKDKGPFFEEGPGPQNVTAALGSTAFLDCRVGLLMGKTVTWVQRKVDSLQLLTVDRASYSSDARFELKFRYPNNWRLQIGPVTIRDEAEYECQVATHPQRVRRLYLKVKHPEPQLKIVDELGRNVHERVYRPGSALQLNCIPEAVSSDLQHPSWTHLGKPVTSLTSSDGTRATLSLDPLKVGHSGLYTCSAGPTASATVSLVVMDGQLPAAVQHGTAAGVAGPGAWAWALVATAYVHS